MIEGTYSENNRKKHSEYHLTTGMYYKHFTIVIYDSSQSVLYYNPPVKYTHSRAVLNLTTVRIVNYAPRVTLQIVASLMIVIYDRNVFIVQDKGASALILSTAVINSSA